ncbi:hypothetical protein [Tuwongella immobilis]|uniref:Uncharacterized protein n=1 Tax=Tuwongella immobilis TaxID=692036 RepID=A0A6C2YNR3_9BACT|nr:hypothetical protein [Tuwongella immobilis]VIP03076.1 Uncharacterized protein OS=Planctomyces brasiliensis (strain ATCC 49424 / DSM 5305 / JCM 21570 / NBRC 103401 / IFAM 1448) GN=Plabr_0221 PE=4 SV=1 [Tuwongella immobilis]VTS03315.1 Uncharacterized protein OS=Planctomyces brasiliensis (strain ATCC 49424 / DSM 5305 / JCM 21570 / NBRC 103401 / IFAM 1448) GN=Plabr_0221 PE=4 SV=1 [Tuwongella immobilis]
MGATNSARKLIESATAAKTPLEVDTTACIIKNVRIVGERSDNCHGIDGVVHGTRYPEATQRDALPLYEGLKVRTNHPDRANPQAERNVFDTFGVLRNCRVVQDPDGFAIRGDLHYLGSHSFANSIVEDVQRALGVYGLSHNANSDPRQDRVENGTLIVGRITEVIGVDIVDQPATNSNLWESKRPMPKKFTLRSLLESQRKRFSKPRRAWLNRLLESENYQEDADPVLDAAAEAPEEASPEAALKAGFRAAVLSVIDDDSPASEKLARLKELLMTQEKLLAATEPSKPESEEDEPTKTESEEDDDKTDSGGTKTESKELVRLRREVESRSLCESLNVKTTPSLLKALCLLESDDQRRELLAGIRPVTAPRSGSPAALPPPTAGAGGGPAPAALPTTDVLYQSLIGG